MRDRYLPESKAPAPAGTGWELSKREAQALLALVGARTYGDLSDEQVQAMVDAWGVTPERVRQITSRLRGRLQSVAGAS